MENEVPKTADLERDLILACGALAPEILEILRLNNFGHIDLHCLPAKLHNRPAEIPKAVEAAFYKYAPHYRRILIAYADCGTGGVLGALCTRLGIEMIEGPHCYAFFQDARYQPEDDVTAFYLTDFLARHFESLVWKGLGLDRFPEHLDLLFGAYERLVYLAQTHNPDLENRARRAADLLGLRYEHRFTGFGALGSTLENWGK